MSTVAIGVGARVFDPRLDDGQRAGTVIYVHVNPV